MKKLQRVYETAEEEGRSVEDVARERYDTLAEFEEAEEEKKIVDEREQRRLSRSQSSSSNHERGRVDNRGEKRWMFADTGNPDSRPSSRASFRRPGAGSDTTPSTPQPQPGSGTSPGTPGPSSVPQNNRVDALRQGRSSTSGSGTPSPIPSVLTPLASHSSGKRALSPSSLNKLQARVLKAKLMGTPDAAELERQFEAERARASAGPSGVVQADGTRVELLPTLDARGRLYDVGLGKEDPALLPGNRRKKDKVRSFHLRIVKLVTNCIRLL